MYLKHGSAKNDFFGAFFAATPSFLPYYPEAPRNACSALMALERAAAVQPERRALTPLFGPSPGEEFTHAQVESAFEQMMLGGAGVSREELADYSIHSFRIFCACALLAANVSRHDIKRLLRWRGDLSLEIYARLNDTEWAAHVSSMYTAHVDSSVAGRLAALGTIDHEYAAIRLAELSAAA